METLKSYKIKVPSDIHNIGNMVGGVIGYLEDSYGVMEESTVFELKVILNELFLNAVKHGNKNDPSKRVKVTAGLTKDECVYVLIEDEGEGYDCRCTYAASWDVLQADVDCCDMKETGRGLIIVRSLCDKICFNKRGNKVVIVKKLCKCHK